MTDITAEQNGKVLKTILTEGSGESPMPGDTVSVHYVGTLLENGDQFDSSRARDQQFEFKLGIGQVIKGWDVGVATMKRGERCELVCDAEYAYGKGGSPPKIPPNATLKFDVELFDFFGEDVSEDKDKSVLKRTIVKSEGWATPNEGAKMKVDIECFSVPENKSFGLFTCDDLAHGEESSKGLPRVVETTLSDMKSGEKCEISVNAKHAFTKSSAAFPDAPMGVAVKFVIELKAFEKCKESWEMSCSEKIEQATMKRDFAKKYLAEGHFELAIKLFEKVVSILEDEVKRPKAAMGEDSDDESDTEGEGEKKEPNGGDVEMANGDAPPPEPSTKTNDESSQQTDPAVMDLIETSQLNLSLCFQKTSDFTKAIEQCENVLNSCSTQARTEKALYRRAQCTFLQHDYQQAKLLFTELIQQFPSNAAAKKLFNECYQKAKAEKVQEKQRYQRMFKNFST